MVSNQQYVEEVLAILNSSQFVGSRVQSEMQGIGDLISAPDSGQLLLNKWGGENFYRLDRVRTALNSIGLNREVGDIMSYIKERSVPINGSQERQSYARSGMVMHAVGLKVRMEPGQRNRLEVALQ